MCTTNFIRITSSMIQTVNEKREEQLTAYKSTPNKKCDDCKIVMSILQPTIVIVYKLWVEREGISDIIASLVTSILQGTTIKAGEQELGNNGPVSDLKLLADGSDNNGLIKKLNEAIEESLSCLATSAGKGIKDLRKLEKKGLAEIIKKGLHSFVDVY